MHVTGAVLYGVNVTTKVQVTRKRFFDVFRNRRCPFLETLYAYGTRNTFYGMCICPMRCIPYA